MGKKTFIILLLILMITFSVAAGLRLYQPESKNDVYFETFPLHKEDWSGKKEVIPQYVMDILKPKEIFSGTYTNDEGIKIHLLFDFFITEGTFGGPHSPRNCLPGSGWVLADGGKREIVVNGRSFNINRINIKQNGTKQIMDFWYVSNYGETSNDFEFKLHSMLSSLTFQPKEVAFIRFITQDDPYHAEAMEEFERLFVDEIYKLIPFQ